jgi:hypothetical protein
LGRRASIALGAALAAVTAAGVWLVVLGPARWAQRSELQWLGTFFEFARGLIQARLDSGFFSAAEVLDYLVREALRPLGLLALAPLAWVVRVRAIPTPERALARDLVPLVLLPAAILSQTGVHERGGYFLFLAPVCALLLAQATCGLRRSGWFAVAAPLLVAQAWLGVEDRAQFLRDTDDPRAFARDVDGIVRAGDRVLVDSLAKWFALSTARRDVAVWDLRRELETTPARLRAERAFVAIGQRLIGPQASSLLFDRALLEGPPRAEWQAALRALLQDPRLVVEEDGDLLLRLRSAPAPGG